MEPNVPITANDILLEPDQTMMRREKGAPGAFRSPAFRRIEPWPTIHCRPGTPAQQKRRWLSKDPFKSVISGDLKTVFAGGLPGLMELVVATHSGMSTDEFESVARKWLATKASSEDQSALYRNRLGNSMRRSTKRMPKAGRSSI
jgi:hypothetical protein